MFKNIKIEVNGRELFSIDDISLAGGTIALVGRNGAGKSTFLRMIVGDHHAFSGNIIVDGTVSTELSKFERAKKIAIVYSKPTLFGNHTGREVLMLGRLPYQNVFAKPTVKDFKKINEIIELLEINGFIDRQFTHMSDGEKQLVMIGRALVQDTKIILLDEPGAFLDLVNRHLLMGIFRKIATELDKLVLFSTHEVGLLEENCSQVLLIENQKLLQLTEKDQFVNRISESFGIPELNKK